jgi:hypothetical protein
MATILIPRIEAAVVLRAMSSGRTKPCLTLCENEAGDFTEVVIKWRSGKQTTPHGLICELISALLAIDLGLPIPKPFLVDVPPNFSVGEGKAELSEIARFSAGLNYGSEKLPPGFATCPKEKPIPVLLRPLAAEIFAFDVLIQNPDRRRENPNLLWNGDEIYLCDHEQAFSFLNGVIGWQPPWTGTGTSFYRNHVLFQQLAGFIPNFDRMTGALEALTDDRLRQYIDVVPNEWSSNNNATSQIVDYLRHARENRAALFSVITHLLQ